MTLSDPTPVCEHDPDKVVAQQAVAAMLENDFCTKSMGMEVVDVAKGLATVSMRVTQTMLNGHNTCHGGMLFALGDTAFAFACNSENLAAVASGCSIEYIRPAFEHDVLTAFASVKSQGRLTGTYDVEIVNQNQKLVALFRGKSHRIGTKLVEENSQ
ncbi:hydroxyphenylacetyl-CoA thioesterase PaaI [Vibrio sp. CAU 1672]|uniref:hydroxyphenylacetyl-CoA thioesterase PaaI n=1 Tax=Vibrio sp. CAU 1672 TaxID=3032594 RepID=UPI0023DA6B5E|nr:hydroxyphenylacetyl-CoA thioesterase PaaI [Vibrio sp. CAU 1672]MDF2154593.1 hydroxyphenylacetyl-CoA thioesterase PaaI [Vibrio sp. CAU 1672]